MELFHAYIVGGTREEARKNVEQLLSPFGLNSPGNPDYAVSDHVNFSMDEARTLISWQSMAPIGDRKAYVAYADFISREAEHALLKTFEEPSAHTHVFLCIPNPEMLLPTLLSRVQVIRPTKTESDSTDAREFLTLSLAEKIKYVGKIVEKGDEEEASALVREKALSFINTLEQELSNDVEKNAKKLELLLKLKKYLYIPGASVKMILETVAMSV